MEEVGASLIARGADQFYRDMDRAEQSVNDFARGVDGAAGSASKGAGLFSGLGGVLGGGLAAGAGVAVGAIVGIGAAIVGSQERLAEFRAVLGQDLPIEQFQAVNEQAALLERRFGADLPSQLDAARQLVANGLVPDMEAAFDVITAGFDAGLNVGDDFLDTLREYSPNFSALGITGDEALSLINRGLEAGARNSDVVADAVKEFGILIREPGTIEAVGALDEGLAGIVTQFQEGKIAGDEALSLITARLGEIEDPIDRNAAGIALFGTLYEDMGEKAILALGQTSEGLIASAGASDEAQRRITSLGEILPRIGDKLGTALAPAGEAVLGFVNDHWPAFEGAIDSGISTAGNFASALGGNKDALAELPGPLAAVVEGVEGAKRAWEAFSQTELGERVISGAQRVGDYFANQFGPDVEKGIGVVTGAFERLGQTEFGKDVMAGAKVVGDYFLNQWPGDLERGVAIAQGALDKIAKSDWWQSVERGAKVVGDYMANDWSNDFSRGVDLVVSTVEGLPDTLETAWNNGITFLKGLPATMLSEGKAIGGALLDGVKAGISEQWGKVTSFIAGQLAKLPEPVRKALGIGSPSRVFADEVGAHIPSGIALGITENIGIVDTALLDTVASGLGVAEGEAPGIGSAISAGIADGIGKSAGIALKAAQKLAKGVTDQAKKDLAIASPSQEFAEIGADVDRGMARGILDNLDLLKDAAKEISWAVLDEAQTFAKTISDAVGPILAEGLQGAASFARSRLGGLDIIEGLAADTGETDEIARRTERLTAELNKAVGAGDRRRVDALRAEFVQLAQESREAEARLAEQRAVQSRTAAELSALREQAGTISDPTERAEFYQLRQSQIAEIGQAELDIVQATTDAERDRARQRLALIKEAQQFETQLAADAAAKRRAELVDQIRLAEDAAKQLGNLIYFSQIDQGGEGDPAIRAAANLIGTLLGGLTQQISGPASAESLLTALLGGGGGGGTVNNFNYNASYGAAPRSPLQDFAVLRSLYGGG